MNKKNMMILILIFMLSISFVVCQNDNKEQNTNNNDTMSDTDEEQKTESNDVKDESETNEAENTEENESPSTPDEEDTTNEDTKQIDIPEKYVGKYIGDYNGLNFYIVINKDSSYSAVIVDSPLFFGNVSEIKEESGFTQLVLDIAGSKDKQKAKLEFYNNETKLVTPNQDVISLKKE